MYEEPLPPEVTELIRELRRPVHVDPDFDDAVMREVRRVPLYQRLTLWARVRRPRTVTVRPLPWAAAFAAVICAVTLGALHVNQALQRSAQLASPTVDAVALPDVSVIPVQFVLVAPSATKVSVVGDFNDWNSRHVDFQAEHQGGGVWSVTAGIPVGHHRYSFIVDDSLWMADPTAPRVADDDFGLPASALVVGDVGQ